MKQISYIFFAIIWMFSIALPVHAAVSQVTYSGNAGEFIFAPGSEYSLTDLFTEFKDVMPGDKLTQKILLKNDASKAVKVKIYMRALGAHEDSEEFLSQLQMTVEKKQDTELFEGSAAETAQLTDWVLLGTLYSGGECELDVILEVPITLDNQFQNLAGYLDWQFAVEEFPVEEGDPVPPIAPDEGELPKTGDQNQTGYWFLLLITAVIGWKKLLEYKYPKEMI